MSSRWRQWRRVLLGGPGEHDFRAVAVAVLACLVVGAVGYGRIARPAYRYRLALGAERAGDAEQVRQEARRLAAVHGYAAQSRLLLAKLMAGRDRLEEAVTLLQLATRAPEPEVKVEALLLQAQCLMRARSFPAAQMSLAEALDSDRDRADIHRWFAELFRQVNAYGLAGEAAEKVAELDPGDPRPHALLGEIYTFYRQPRLAAKALAESLRRNPQQFGHVELRLDCAEALKDSGRLDEALALLHEMPSVERSPRALYLEADCLRIMGRGEQASAILDRALTIDPNDSDCLLLQGRMWLARHEPRRAETPLTLLAERYPADARVHQLLASVYELLDQPDLSQEHAQRYKHLANVAEEYTVLLSDAEQDPRDPDVRYLLGQSAQELGRVDEARRWLEAALALDPEHVPSRQALAVLDGS